MKPIAFAALVLALAAGAPVLAQEGHGAHQAAPAGGASPANDAYRAANARMHKDMDLPLTGDADVDFFRGMIPHHQGAIDMARIVLEFGKDAETKRLAAEIIAAQEKEIATMRAWLKQRGY